VDGSVTPRSGGGAGGGEAVEWRGASGGVTRPPMSHLEDDEVAVSVSRSRQHVQSSEGISDIEGLSRTLYHNTCR